MHWDKTLLSWVCPSDTWAVMMYVCVCVRGCLSVFVGVPIGYVGSDDVCVCGGGVVVVDVDVVVDYDEEDDDEEEEEEEEE